MIITPSGDIKPLTYNIGVQTSIRWTKGRGAGDAARMADGGGPELDQARPEYDYPTGKPPSWHQEAEVVESTNIYEEG